MPTSLKAIKPHRYAGKLMAVGQVYQARTTSDARVLKACGWAQEAHVADPASPSTPSEKLAASIYTPIHYETAAITAEASVESDTSAGLPSDSPSADQDETPTRRKRSYKRRDLTAEDE